MVMKLLLQKGGSRLRETDVKNEFHDAEGWSRCFAPIVVRLMVEVYALDPARRVGVREWALG
jgi:hypothetical protein